MTVALVAMFAGYTVASYGWVLLKDYDITFREWVSPLNPWQWSGTPARIPGDRVFPGG